MSKVTISQIINYSYVRYDRLVELVNLEYSGSNSSKINIYIDLYSILKPLYSSNIVIDDYTEITSCIVNMCAHYKYFFKSRYNVDSRIYLIWSNNTPYKNISLYPNYNSKFISSRDSNTKITSMISNNLELLEILCPYIPDVMFVKDIYEAGVIAKYISRMQDNVTTPGLMVTRDLYNYQLASGLYDMKILVPHKGEIMTSSGSRYTDMSYIVNELNSVKTYCYRNKIDVSEYANISGKLLSLLMALSRCPFRNIYSLYDMPKAYKIILDLLDNKIISNGHIYETDPIAQYLKMESTDLKLRYYICDIDSQLIHYELDPAINIKQSMVNLYDPDEVRNINNRYFQKYPLDLNRL